MDSEAVGNDQGKTPAKALQLPAWLTGAPARELGIIVPLLALCVLVRVLWLTPVDIYWDAGIKWHFARQLTHANQLVNAPWSHHLARSGVIIPAYLVRRLCGSGPTVYYVWPVASFTLQVLLTYLLSKRLAGRGAAIFAAIVLTLFTGLTRSTSQLLPDGLSGTAAMLAAYAFVRFHEEAGRERLRWLVVVGLGCIWAYMIKETSVLFFPGVFLAVLLSRRSFKEVFILGGMLLAYLVVETLIVRAVTPFAHRLAIVQDAHGFYQPVTFYELVVRRFTKLESEWQLLLLVAFLGSVYQAVFGDRRARLLLLFPLSFLFFLTFLVRRVDPLVQWITFKSRYMAPVAPFAVVMIAFALAGTFRRVAQKLPEARLRPLLSLFTERAPLWTFGLCALVGFLVYRDARPSLDDHPLVRLRRDSEILNDAYRRNLPIVQKAKLPKGGDAIYGPRGLNTVYGVYLNDRELARDNYLKPGVVPNITEGVHLGRKKQPYSYIWRDPRAFAVPRDLEQMIDQGCALEVYTKHNEVALRAKRKLPAKCRPPSATAGS